jgi:DNA-binding GntR family transcriptional regulator
MPNSPLAARIAGDIVAEIGAGALPPGSHLATESLALRFMVSRSPVREALRMLIDRGFVEQRQNRGCFVSDKPPLAANDIKAELGSHSVEERYFTFADDWLTDRIEAEVAEQYVRERYHLTKAQAQDMLARAAREGWAEPKPGYGWRLLPVAKTAAAYDEIFRFRAVIEPAGILEPTFRFDRVVAGELRRVQEKLAAGGLDRVPPDQMTGPGVRFHEELIRMSGNAMFVQALERANQLRRIVEYRLAVQPDRIIRQSQEHLVILDHLERGDMLDAAHAMKTHLTGALKVKSAIVYPDEVSAP